LLVKRFFFLLNAAFAMAILDLISQVHLPSSVSDVNTKNYYKNCNVCSASLHSEYRKMWHVSTHLNILKIPRNTGPPSHIIDSETVEMEAAVCTTGHKIF